MFSLFIKNQCLLHFQDCWEETETSFPWSLPFFLPQHTTNECNRILPTYCWVWHGEWITFCSQMSCSVMSIATNRWCWYPKEESLHAESHLYTHPNHYKKKKCPMCPVFEPLWSVGTLEDDYCCGSHLLFGDYPKAAKYPTAAGFTAAGLKWYFTETPNHELVRKHRI